MLNRNTNPYQETQALYGSLNNSGYCISFLLTSKLYLDSYRWKAFSSTVC